VLIQPALSALMVTAIALAPTYATAHARAHPSAVQLGIADPAQSACARMERVTELVAADASYPVVLVEVAEAKAEAERATADDPSWRPLLGAVGAIDNGLRSDDPAASAVGISVVRYACNGGS
jgi:hypothetical protein